MGRCNSEEDLRSQDLLLSHQPPAFLRWISTDSMSVAVIPNWIRGNWRRHALKWISGALGAVVDGNVFGLFDGSDRDFYALVCGRRSQTHFPAA
jgi:hypothetical protein